MYLHEIGRRLARRHTVTLYCGSYSGCKREEEVDGLRIIRRGGEFTVYLHALFDYLIRRRKEKFDVIVDSINGVPFFTPLFVARPKVAIVHHLVGKEIFFRELGGILGFLAWIAERLIPLLYRKTWLVTVSQSTKTELIDFGLAEERLRLVPNAIEQGSFAPREKSPNPQVVYLGRIKKYKQIDHVIKAFELARETIPEAKLIIGGKGVYSELKELVAELQLESAIHLVGEVSEGEKVEILQNSWAFVTPSMKEGWGISVIEANACGTPAIAYDVPGLRDSIRDGETGLLVSPGDIEELAKTIVRLLNNRELRIKLSQNALIWARGSSWEKSAEEFDKVLSEVLNES
ncbi:glycosyltransferase family 4 protein [Chloroflexota bacterium]